MSLAANHVVNLGSVALGHDFHSRHLATTPVPMMPKEHAVRPAHDTDGVGAQGTHVAAERLGNMPRCVSSPCPALPPPSGPPMTFYHNLLKLFLTYNER
jgi:hypothetical protein